VEPPFEKRKIILRLFLVFNFTVLVNTLGAEASHRLDVDKSNSPDVIR